MLSLGGQGIRNGRGLPVERNVRVHFNRNFLPCSEAVTGPHSASSILLVAPTLSKQLSHAVTGPPKGYCSPNFLPDASTACCTALKADTRGCIDGFESDASASRVLCGFPMSARPDPVSVL